MLQLKSKQNLASEAHTLAKGNKLVRHRGITYLPVDYETGKYDVVPEPKRTVWKPLTRKDIQLIAADQFGTLFASDGELSSFDFMLAQNAIYHDSSATSLLIRTDAGLKQLNQKGQLKAPSGKFVPNAIAPYLNEDVAEKDRVFNVIAEWVDSEEEAHSLLYHLATVLSPGWSAVKYVLLLGEGRNGKSLMLKMLLALLGRENVSTVTRQHISEQSPVVCELNGKLLNSVFDGRAEYLKDSGTEKSLIAGETVPIRRLYESSATPVQTNALFIEGLNKEPKSNDKSSALQKRLVRFQFPNVYALDHKFEKLMLSDAALGAFLSILIDHYVKEDELAQKLAPTAKAIELQLEHMYVNSLALQFLKYVMEKGDVADLLAVPVNEVAQQFQSWRVKENDLSTWSEPDVLALFTPLMSSERRSIRVEGQPRKVRVFTSFKSEARAFLDSLKEDADDQEVAVVED